MIKHCVNVNININYKPYSTETGGEKSNYSALQITKFQNKALTRVMMMMKMKIVETDTDYACWAQLLSSLPGLTEQSINSVLH